MDKNKNAGRIAKGEHRSPATEFKSGQHWRPRKPYYDKEWLEREYVEKQRSAGDIAKEFGVTDASVLVWLRKHSIPRRNVSEARKVKHWGALGVENPMHGKTGEQNGNWKGGVTPLRQAVYSSEEWGEAVKIVWVRDERCCQRCGARPKGRGGRHFHIHHVVSFAVEALRTDPSNLVLLCAPCHHWVHSRVNVEGLFMDGQKGGLE